jgi:predicted Rossmann fold flavoprotein
MKPQGYDAVILGAGAAGMFCAGVAAQRGTRVLVLDHARTPGEKIRISGGGRCNFTNLGTGPAQFLSGNPHFAKSALARYTPADFVALVERHRIPWHVKTLGQAFCDRSAKDIIAMLRAEMDAGGAEMRLGVSVTAIAADGAGFRVGLSDGTEVAAPSLVVATGGKSVPKIGATSLGYDIARQFGLAVTDTRPALVPLTFGGAVLEGLAALAGLAAPARVSAGGAAFDEALLFTHRGLSGPAILQVSSFWREGQAIAVDLAPGRDVAAWLRDQRRAHGRRGIAGVLSDLLPARLAADVAARAALTGNLADQSDARLAHLATALTDWRLTPTGTEGYRTAEVTLGGVDTAALDARTMEARAIPGLFFIGEVVDVTGWLGGYNFQWAWASGHACALALADRRPA